jgi:hypothetical protein
MRLDIRFKANVALVGIIASDIPGVRQDLRNAGLRGHGFSVLRKSFIMKIVSVDSNLKIYRVEK